jgi:hypothetical protein
MQGGWVDGSLRRSRIRRFSVESGLHVDPGVRPDVVRSCSQSITCFELLLMPTFNIAQVLLLNVDFSVHLSVTATHKLLRDVIRIKGMSLMLHQ